MPPPVLGQRLRASYQSGSSCPLDTPPTAAKRQSLKAALNRLRPRHTLASVFSSMVERTASLIRSFYTAPP